MLTMNALARLTTAACLFAVAMIFLNGISRLLTRWNARRAAAQAEQRRRITRRLREAVRPIEGLRPARAVVRRERGQALVEFALLMPLFLLCLLFVLDVGVMLQESSSVAFVSQQTALCMARSACGSSANDFAASVGGGLGLANLSTTASCSASICSATVQTLYKPFGPFAVQTVTRTATAVIPN